MIRFTAIVLGCLWIGPVGWANSIGRQVADFSLADAKGGQQRLKELANGGPVVVAFLGTECPLAKLYAHRLAELAREDRGRKVAFIGIDSNRQDSLADIAAFVDACEIPFPILKDEGAVIADQFGATRTPEVFLLDEKGVIRYQGRIDDQFGVGYSRKSAQEHYLAAAIDQLLAGQAIETASVPAVGCLIGRSRPTKENAEVTYSNQIARIFQARCVECHRAGEIGPFELTDYSKAAGWADMIDEVVREGRMPPWHASHAHKAYSNDRSLAPEERDLIHRWVAAGAPEGDPSDLPEPLTFVEGWSLPREPDVVIDVQRVPFKVPADGVVGYQNYIVDPGFTEDKWVVASQILPGAPSVVHHVLCFVMPPDQSSPSGLINSGGLGFLSAYVPGYRPTPYGDGMAKRIPAGSRLRFQMHYTPDGKPREDLSKIGLVFADPSEVTEMVQTVSAVNPGLSIPPHTSDYSRMAIASGYRHPVRLLAMSPHMHLRGKSFSYEVLYPDGRTETVLDIPQYDFNWQTNYELAEPIELPPGTKIRCVASWDNSSANLANPDPSKTVTWGDQSWDEMMIGFFDVAVAINRERFLKEGVAPRLIPDGSIEDRIRDLMVGLDVNGDGKITQDELPERFRTFFALADRNGDGQIDEAEFLALLEMRRRLGGMRGQPGGGPRGGFEGRRDRSRRSTRGNADPPQ